MEHKDSSEKRSLRNMAATGFTAKVGNEGTGKIARK
jgi:hypothetical protein